MSIKILNENLKSLNFNSLYYIYGEEEYLKNYYFSALKEKAVTELVEFNVIEFDSKNFNYLDFCNTVNSYPVMSERKLVTVTDFDNSLLKGNFTKEFVAFLKDIPDFCTVVFFDGPLKNITSSNPLLKAVTASNGVAIEVKHPDMKSLTNWAIRHFKNFGKTVFEQDVHYLIDIADSDMMSLSNEISKLCNYVVDAQVTKADIDKLVTKSIDTNRYEIAEAFCDFNYDKLLSIIDKLYKQNVDDIVISNLFYRSFGDMYKAKLALEVGRRSADFAADFKLNPYAATKIMKNAQKLTKATLEKSVILALKLDRDLKSTQLNKRGLIFTFIAELAECRNNG